MGVKQALAGFAQGGFELVQGTEGEAGPLPRIGLRAQRFAQLAQHPRPERLDLVGDGDLWPARGPAVDGGPWLERGQPAETEQVAKLP